MNRIRAGVLLVIVLAALFGQLTGDWKFSLAIIGIAIAVGAEIDISMHRRDHDRRSTARRKGDPQ